MAVLNLLKKYITAGTIILICGLGSVVFFLGRCVKQQRAEIQTLKVELELQKDYINFLRVLHQKDKEVDNETRKKIDKIDNSSDTVELLNGLYKKGLRLPPGENSKPGKADTAKSGIQG